MTTNETISGASRRTVIAVFVALIVDGMDLQMLALALPSISKEMNLSGVSAGALATYTLFGMGIGGILAGWLSDRVGRVRITWWSILLFSVGTSVIGLCSSYWQVAAARFFSGFGIGSVYSIGTLLVAELVPTKMRATATGMLQAGWSVGFIVAAMASAYIIPAFGWRALFLCAIVPGMLSLALMHGAVDPASWVTARQATPTRGGNQYARIWADRSGRRMLILWSLTSIALQFGYYGANTWLPSYLVKDMGLDLRSMGWYVAGTYVMMIVGKVITGFLGDLLGRRFVWLLAGVVTALYVPIMMYVATPANVAYLLLAFGFLYGAPYAINATYLSESFPVSFRGTAVAAAHGLGRVGSMISPLMIGYVSATYSVGLGIGLLGISYAIAGLIPGIFIPDRMFDPRAVTNAAADIDGDGTLTAFPHPPVNVQKPI
jgi:MFS transporter, AAHS family, cis,cis-muconate transporter